MNVEKLLSIASDSIALPVSLTPLPSDGNGSELRRAELLAMLSMRNGFYAFESALHVLPSSAQRTQDAFLNIQIWNQTTLWRDRYLHEGDDLLFFAEDIFGGQFAIKGEHIVSFEPESGEVEVIAKSIDDWAAQLLLNYRELTGQPLARAWQEVHGAIPLGRRLLPKVPFILGGQYHQENLVAVDAIEGMRYRGELWQQLRDLPDGAQVVLKPLPLH